jgi:hypothetical protein
MQSKYSAWCLVGLLVDPENGGGEFFRSVCKRLPDYTALHSHHCENLESRTVCNHVSFRKKRERTAKFISDIPVQENWSTFKNWEVIFKLLNDINYLNESLFSFNFNAYKYVFNVNSTTKERLLFSPYSGYNVEILGQIPFRVIFSNTPSLLDLRLRLAGIWRWVIYKIGTNVSEEPATAVFTVVFTIWRRT